MIKLGVNIDHVATIRNARGEFYPCCWVATRYGHNDKWAETGKKYNLHEKQLPKGISEALQLSWLDYDAETTSDRYWFKERCLRPIVARIHHHSF